MASTDYHSLFRHLTKVIEAGQLGPVECAGAFTGPQNLFQIALRCTMTGRVRLCDLHPSGEITDGTTVLLPAANDNRSESSALPIIL